MADEIDRANEAAEFFQSIAFRNLPKPAPAPTGIGMCLHCGNALHDSRRWCDAACRDDWEKGRR